MFSRRCIVGLLTIGVVAVLIALVGVPDKRERSLRQLGGQVINGDNCTLTVVDGQEGYPEVTDVTCCGRTVRWIAGSGLGDYVFAHRPVDSSDPYPVSYCQDGSPGLTASYQGSANSYELPTVGTYKIRICTNTSGVYCDHFTHDPEDDCSPGIAYDLTITDEAQGSCAVCGDGVEEPPEQCDDGNGEGGDGCSAECTLEFCGNGVKEIGEECDDGNTADGDGCSSTCQLEAACGNGQLESGEQCEKVNGVFPQCCNGTTCAFQASNVTCRLAVGPCDQAETCMGSSATCPADGFKPSSTVCRASAGACDTEEKCSGTSATCPSDSFAPNTTVCRASTNTSCDPVETCSGSSSTCPSDVNDCSGTTGGTGGGVGVCGDGNLDAGEGCDDGNTQSGDGCSKDCKEEICGNKVKDIGEGCDDGNTTDGDGCSSACTIESCGNGTVDAGEDCDDGNTKNDDDCTNACTNAICGDTIVWKGGSEECDDGNTNDEDACSNSCMKNVCGNDRIDAGEDCDDKNTKGGDGCSALCKTEVCGNGVQDIGEDCDRGEENSDEPNASCRSDCMKQRCGDEIHDDKHEEECDAGENNGKNDEEHQSTCTAECKLTACADGKDTDGDGQLDPPDGLAPIARIFDWIVRQWKLPDRGCFWKDQVAPWADETKLACNNKTDDDGDGFIDDDDPACKREVTSTGFFRRLWGSLLGQATSPLPVGDSETLITQCSNCDNDLNGTCNNMDANCSDPRDNEEFPDPPVTDPDAPDQCGDGKDNDGDGLTDQADPSCQDTVPFCGNGRKDGQEQCNEPGLNCGTGKICNVLNCKCIDENETCGNGKADPGEECGDASLTCGAGKTCDFANCTCSTLARSEDECLDSKDNDEDGLIDLNDPACRTGDKLHESYMSPFGGWSQGINGLVSSFYVTSSHDKSPLKPGDIVTYNVGIYSNYYFNALYLQNFGLLEPTGQWYWNNNLYVPPWACRTRGCACKRKSGGGIKGFICKVSSHFDDWACKKDCKSQAGWFQTSFSVQVPETFAAKQRTYCAYFNSLDNVPGWWDVWTCFTVPACMDSIDNDDDGLMDMEDPGCSSAGDTDESDATSQCQDGDDNKDGSPDFPADECCDSPEDTTENSCKGGSSSSASSSSSVCPQGLTACADLTCDSSNACSGTKKDVGNGCCTCEPDCTVCDDCNFCPLHERCMNIDCGDGILDPGEECGEPTLPACPAGRTCDFNTCRCQTGSSSSSSFSSSIISSSSASSFSSSSIISSSSASSFIGTHLACRDNQCIAVPGVGIQECQVDSDCLVSSFSSQSFSSSPPSSPPSSSSTSSVRISQCSDGRDNDTDGLIDSPDDPGCYGPQDDDERDGSGLPQCSDGLDNDSDGLIDAWDPDCHTDGNPANPDSYDPNRSEFGPFTKLSIPTACSDGLDNDGDARIDFPNDPGCTSPEDNNELDPPESCGNGLVDAPVEECDDGNRNDFDGCSSVCHSEVGFCGDGIVQRLLGEQCEPPLINPALPFDCRICRFSSRFCGNGEVNEGEECDLGANNADVPDSLCRTDCSFPRCGDGILDAFEECDPPDALLPANLLTDTRRARCSLFCRIERHLQPQPGYFTQQPLSGPLAAQLQQYGRYLPLAPYGQSAVIAPRAPQPIAQPETGPAALAIIISGAAGGWAWVSRKRQ